VPALLGRTLLPELLALDGHQGARRVIQAHSEETLAVEQPVRNYPGSQNEAVRLTAM
jgi:hypothetical protein